MDQILPLPFSIHFHHITAIPLQSPSSVGTGSFHHPRTMLLPLPLPLLRHHQRRHRRPRHLRMSQATLRRHHRRTLPYRWICQTRCVLTTTRSNTASSISSGQLSSRAEAKKLRRSNRKPNPNEKPRKENSQIAKKIPTGPRLTGAGPKSGPNKTNQSFNAAKSQHYRGKK